MEKQIIQSADLDIRIIDILFYDADLTYKEIARKLRLNASTVRKRILALKRRGVIRRFMVEVDEERLGRKLNVSLALDVDATKFLDVSRKLVATPEIAMAFQTSGGHDIYLVVWTRDRESLTQIIKKISSIDGIIKVIPSFIMERLK